MGSRILFVILLAASAVVLVIANIRVWTADRTPLPSEARTAAAVQAPAVKLVRKSPEPKASFEPLVAGNLFAAEREEIIEEITPPPPATVAQAEPEKEPEPELRKVSVDGTTIILHGIIALDDFKKALITNPRRGEAEKENIWVREGEKISNLEVDTIAPDRIILKENKQRFIVLLHDESKPQKKEQGRKEIKPTVVTTTPVSPKPAAPRTESTSARADSGEDEYIMVRTPFGTIKRKK